MSDSNILQFMSDSNVIRSYVPSLIRCDTCGKGEGDLKDKLKRCGGCGISRYCSKECQQAGWPKHKFVCRSESRHAVAVNVDLCKCHKKLGYPTTVTLASAMRRRTDAHVWTLTTLANAVLYPAGADQTLLDPSKAVVFYLHAAKNEITSEDWRYGSPATEFNLGNAAIEDRKTHAHLSPAWGELKNYCVAQSIRTRLAPDADPNFLGFVPAIVVINGAAVITHQKYPIFRLKVRHVPEDPKNELTQKAFDNYVDLLLGAASSGYLFQTPDDPAEELPWPGVYCKNKKTKTWTFERIVWDWDAENNRLTKTIGPLASGLAIKTHFCLFRTQLCE